MSGKFWKWIHFAGIFVVAIIWIVAGIMKWLESVTFVSHVSMAALLLAEISSWQGSRTEMKQDQQIEENQEIDKKQNKKLFDK